MRRRQAPAVPLAELPSEIAEGARVSRWADPRALMVLAALPVDDPGRREAVDAVKLTAFRRYLDAVAQYERDTEGPTMETRRRVWRRPPYFDPPGTPAPERIGYAAEPHASQRSWSRRPPNAVSSTREDGE